MMTEGQMAAVRRMRAAGEGYLRISQELGVKRSAVREYCARAGLKGPPEAVRMNTAAQAADGRHCPNCGREIVQGARGKRRKFCSDGCRAAWWGRHRELHRRGAASIRTYRCLYCGREFTAYAAGERRYCCHGHYIRDRYYRMEDGREPYGRKDGAEETEDSRPEAGGV